MAEGTEGEEAIEETDARVSCPFVHGLDCRWTVPWSAISMDGLCLSGQLTPCSGTPSFVCETEVNGRMKCAEQEPTLLMPALASTVNPRPWGWADAPFLPANPKPKGSHTAGAPNKGRHSPPMPKSGSGLIWPPILI